MANAPSIRCVLLVLTTLALLGCRTSRTAVSSGAATPPAACPAEAPAPSQLPFERAPHALAEYWINRMPQPDQLVLDATGIAAHNLRVHQLAREAWPTGPYDLLAPAVEHETLRAHMAASLARLHRLVSTGKRVVADGTKPWAVLAKAQQLVTASRASDELRIVNQSTPLHCYPTSEGLYESRTQLAFDLNRCSQLRYGEAVRVIAKTATLWHVWAPYAAGWVAPRRLSAALRPEQAKAYLHPQRFAVISRDKVAVWSARVAGDLLGVARLGTHFPLLAAEHDAIALRVPEPTGTTTGWIRQTNAVTVEHPALTRANLLERAFSLLNTPYGLGGMGDKRDCSRLLMDLFGSFGVVLPRNSARQSLAGTHRIDMAKLDDGAKRAAIIGTAQHGIVLLYLPGHIMLYVGQDRDHLYALHQLSGYLAPCRQGGETMRRVNRVAVTALELGRGSSRRSFLERITLHVVFGARAAPLGG